MNIVNGQRAFQLQLCLNEFSDLGELGEEGAVDAEEDGVDGSVGDDGVEHPW